MTDQEKQLVAHFKSLLMQRLQNLDVIVFGSRARGEADADSDLDVLVLSEEPENAATRTFVSDCAWEAGLGSGMVIAPLLIGQEQWRNGLESASLLAQAVRREGIPV
jgi:hypothetical protein